MLTRRHVLGAGAAGLAVLAGGCATTASRLRGPALISDARLLRRAYETLHPGLYRYNTKPEMDALFERLEADWAKGRALPEAYLSLSGLLAKVRCGHTYANFYVQSDAVSEALFAGPGKLPFLFTWLGGKMVVTDPQGTDGLARGDVVEQINGVRSEVILKTLLPYVRADGNNQAKRVSLMSVSGLDTFATFDVFHGLAYGRAENLRLEIVAADGSRRKIEVRSITLAERRARMTPEPEGGAAFTRHFDANGACVFAHAWLGAL